MTLTEEQKAKLGNLVGLIDAGLRDLIENWDVQPEGGEDTNHEFVDKLAGEAAGIAPVIAQGLRQLGPFLKKHYGC